MKKLLYLLLALPFVACSEQLKTEVEAKTPVLTLTSEAVVSFDDDGGKGVIRYTLENKIKGVEPSVESTAEWICDFVVGEDITFDILQNDGRAREAVVTVKYEALSFEVTVKQEALFDGYKLSYSAGTYYAPGTPANETDAHNYYVALSSAEDLSGYYLPENSYMELDFWAATGDVECPSIPLGKYTIDVNESCAPGTIGCAYSRFIYFDADYNPVVWILPIEGEVIVSEDKIEGWVADSYGKVTFRYKGTLAVALDDGEEY